MTSEDVNVLATNGELYEHLDCKLKLNPPFLEIYNESPILMQDGQKGFVLVATYIMNNIIRWSLVHSKDSTL